MTLWGEVGARGGLLHSKFAELHERCYSVPLMSGDTKAQIDALLSEVRRDIDISTKQRIYCNRNLRMEGIELIGWDMDYTLALYNQERLEKLSIDLTLQKLVANHGYPEEITGLSFPSNLAIRGIVLDCPSGIGRISLPLARRGIRVTAVDFEKSYLDELEKKARRAQLPIRVIQADMRRVQFRSQFKAAANLGTSFGYFASELDDLLVLRRMIRSLRRGGKFLLHNVNRDWIIHTFQETDWQEIGDLRILQKRSLDYENSILSSTWRFVRDGKEHSHVTLLRLYSYHEQLRLFERAGFIDVHGYGSVKDDVVDRNHRMLWIIGTKP